jgi:hypothetical protein
MGGVLGAAGETLRSAPAPVFLNSRTRYARDPRCTRGANPAFGEGRVSDWVGPEGRGNARHEQSCACLTIERSSCASKTVHDRGLVRGARGTSLLHHLAVSSSCDDACIRRICRHGSEGAAVRGARDAGAAFAQAPSRSAGTTSR